MSILGLWVVTLGVWQVTVEFLPRLCLCLCQLCGLFSSVSPPSYDSQCFVFCRACVILGVIFLLSSICIVVKAIHDLSTRLLPEVVRSSFFLNSPSCQCWPPGLPFTAGFLGGVGHVEREQTTFWGVRRTCCRDANDLVERNTGQGEETPDR